jgi:mannosyltransferase OCH1-like enzyme
MLLASILISSSPGDESQDLPPLVAENIESLKAAHPDLPHRLFVEQDVIDLLRKKFPPAVLNAYSTLQPFAYRADLARYCILYEFGGIYADLAYFIVDAIPISEGWPVFFRGNLVSAPWDTSNGLIFAPPRHKALKRAIEMVCINVKRRYYGLNGLCPTGPALLGKAVASTCEAEEVLSGEAKLLLRENVEKLAPKLSLPEGERIHCQVLNRRLIAVKRKGLQSQGLAELGITTGNLYLQYWANKEVYS